VRELVVRRSGKGFKEEFMGLVHEIFTDKAVHFSIKERYYLQLEEAFVLAKESKDKRLIDWLYDLYYFCTYRGYGDFYLRLVRGVEELFPGDKWALRVVYGNGALILKSWEKLEGAMALHKKEETICEKLGDRAGLARTWWNQGLIYNQKKDYKKQAQLWQKSIQMNQSIGIPTAEDEKALAELEEHG
jgi:tetratricopeptide (TPR) repeat protein